SLSMSPSLQRARAARGALLQCASSLNGILTMEVRVSLLWHRASVEVERQSYGSQAYDSPHGSRAPQTHIIADAIAWKIYKNRRDDGSATTKLFRYFAATPSGESQRSQRRFPRSF